MAASFTLEKRANKYGEQPIRLSWSFSDDRYQTTLGFSIKKENWDTLRKEVKADTHNIDGVKADEINHYIRRIKSVVNGIEQYYKARLGKFPKERKQGAIKDALSREYHAPLDIIEKWTSNVASSDDRRERFYRDSMGQYYVFVCNAFNPYNNDEYYILQELFGSTKRVIIPVRDFEKVKDHSMYARAKYEEVTEDEALGRK